MTAFDKISLAFVGICAIGVAYLVLVEPIREWLHDRRHSRKNSKH